MVLSFAWCETIKFAIGRARQVQISHQLAISGYIFELPQCPGDSVQVSLPLIANEPQRSNVSKIGFVHLVANFRPLKETRVSARTVRHLNASLLFLLLGKLILL